MDWDPLIEAGVKTEGIWVKALRFDEMSNRAPTFLLKFEAGAAYPEHRHPAGEEAFVLEGEVRFGVRHLREGDYLYTPPEASIQSIPRRAVFCFLSFLKK